ncbi:SDR family NAD(P)-dependent oxidoreductase [Paenibacillus bouchesdurhonensis]|uniref:SDR family NAD(P)-dependent oxidoreductase n=1 Tax=Paenibacillus bouchesdurhonensis TaxID=1870990 RepID=UPI0019025330|nr:SDR family NAD(P)-dependent oxidoreductase [Paenibacillus bouchesdurhonensis]
MISINMNGKVAIVTGSASGLGKAIALRFAQAGADVVVADINISSALETAEEIKSLGRNAITFQIDTRDAESFSKLIEAATENLGGLDFMINNAGIGMMKPIDEFSVDEIDRLIDINLKGTIHGCKAALAYMMPRNSGRIVNLSSIAVKMASPYSSVYAGAKAGVIAFTAALAREAASANININAICPGIIRTDMWEKQLNEMAGEGNEEEKAKAFAAFTDTIPLRRPQEPEDIANMALFLCSDLANNITAQTFAVDGGATV